jgi:hypothetical protein
VTSFQYKNRECLSNYFRVFCVDSHLSGKVCSDVKNHHERFYSTYKGIYIFSFILNLRVHITQSCYYILYIKIKTILYHSISSVSVIMCRHSSVQCSWPKLSWPKWTKSNSTVGLDFSNFYCTSRITMYTRTSVYVLHWSNKYLKREKPSQIHKKLSRKLWFSTTVISNSAKNILQSFFACENKSLLNVSLIAHVAF